MTTKEQMAIDVFSGGVEIRYHMDGYYRTYVYIDLPFYEEPQLEMQRKFSDYEMAELNDLAVEMWNERILSDEDPDFFTQDEIEDIDGPWRLEERP
jgi:hypothetical protein